MEKKIKKINIPFRRIFIDTSLPENRKRKSIRRKQK